MSAPEENIAEEAPTQASTEITPPSPSIARSPPSQFPSEPIPSRIASPTGIPYSNVITISIPNFSLPYFIQLWGTLSEHGVRIAPLLFRRNIVLYCIIFLVIQLVLMIFYQHQTTNTSNDYIKIRKMDVDFETFVNLRKDRTNTTTVVFADNQNIEWVHNFMHDIKHMKMDNFIIFARDIQVCSLVDRQGCYVLKSSDHHTTMKSYKYAVWQALLEAGVHVLSVDPDVILLDNPVLYFDHTVDLNIMVEYPGAITSKWTDELEQAGLCCTGRETYYSSGFFYMKSTAATLLLLEEMKAKEAVGLQEALNLAILKVPSLKVRGLDRDMFANGFVGFLESSPTRKNFDTIVYKLNWAEPLGKLNRARELLHWHLDPVSRYTPQRKYLTYTTADDFVSLQVEHDFLALAYYIAKVLDRSLILPKFHCYVGEPATCHVDALLDPTITEASDVFENSFLQNPQVPHENLRRKKLSLRRFPSVAELIDYLDKVKNMPLIDLTFPSVDEDGSHLSLEMLEDRASTEDLAGLLSTVERAVRTNTNGLFASKFTREVQQQLNTEEFTCIVTCPYKLAQLVERVKAAKNDLVYMVTNDPTLPTHKDARKFLETKLPNLVLGHEASWTGHRLLVHHSAPTHLQMAACAQSDHVIINSWEPAWLIGGICDMRRVLGKDECEFLMQDPWISDPWLTADKRNSVE